MNKLPILLLLILSACTTTKSLVPQVVFPNPPPELMQPPGKMQTIVLPDKPSVTGEKKNGE